MIGFQSGDFGGGYRRARRAFAAHPARAVRAIDAGRFREQIEQDQVQHARQAQGDWQAQVDTAGQFTQGPTNCPGRLTKHRPTAALGIQAPMPRQFQPCRNQ